MAGGWASQAVAIPLSVAEGRALLERAELRGTARGGRFEVRPPGPGGWKWTIGVWSAPPGPGGARERIGLVRLAFLEPGFPQRAAISEIAWDPSRSSGATIRRA